MRYSHLHYLRHLDQVHSTPSEAVLDLSRVYDKEPSSLTVTSTDIYDFSITEDYGIYAERLHTQTTPPAQNISSFQKLLGEVQRAFELGLDITLETSPSPGIHPFVISVGTPLELTFNLSTAKLSIKEPFSEGTHYLTFNQAELRTDPILITFYDTRTPMLIKDLNDLRTFHSKFLHKTFTMNGLGHPVDGILRDITFTRYPSDDTNAVQAVLTIEDIDAGRRSTTSISLKDLEYGLHVFSKDTAHNPVPAPPFTLSYNTIVRVPLNSNTLAAKMPALTLIKNVSELFKSTPYTLQITKGDGHITSEFMFESMKRVPHNTDQFCVSLFSTQFRFTIDITTEDIQRGYVQRKELI